MQLKRRSHWNTFQQNDRDTMKENKKVKGEKLRVMVAISWKIWTTEWHHRNHIYVYIVIIIELLNYYFKSQTLIQSKEFCFMASFPPMNIVSWWNMTYSSSSVYKRTYCNFSSSSYYWNILNIYIYIYIIVYLTDDNNHCSEKMLPPLSFSSSVAPTVRKLKLIQ